MTKEQILEQLHEINSSLLGVATTESVMINFLIVVVSQLGELIGQLEAEVKAEGSASSRRSESLL